MDWGRKCLLDFNPGKTYLVSFGLLLMLSMDGPVLEENSHFKMLELTFSSKLVWGSYIISIAKTAFK